MGDHDFTKLFLIPSVVLHAKIPDTLQGLWYSGKVLVGLKYAVFQASSQFGMQQNCTRFCILQLKQKAFFVSIQMVAQTTD